MIDRYSLSKMSRIWSDEHKMEIMLKIEILACESMTKLGVIPKQAMEKIRKNAKFDLEEVRRIEERTKHGAIKFTNDRPAALPDIEKAPSRQQFQCFAHSQAAGAAGESKRGLTGQTGTRHEFSGHQGLDMGKHPLGWRRVAAG